MIIDTLFLWFYRLDIHNALIILAVGTVLFGIVRALLRKKYLWRPISALLLSVCFAVIFFSTLAGRSSGLLGQQKLSLPFYLYYSVLHGGNSEILRSNFMNVVLFYPAGLLACELLPKNWSRAKRIIFVTILFALMSVAIEFCQYHFALGQAEADDVIHNTLGALIGALVSTIPVNGILRKLKKTAN